MTNRRAEEFSAQGAAQVTETAAETDNGEITGPTLNAPMGGTVIELLVKPGDVVKRGQEVMVYEAMKMQNNIESEMEGVVKRILVAPGDVIGTGQPLIEFVDENAPEGDDDCACGGPTLNAPMGGTVIEILVKKGDAVKKGQEVMVYEAMKMQNNIESEIEGVVNRILVEPGDVIGANQPLIEFKKK